jgi:hypothetical protein
MRVLTIVFALNRGWPPTTKRLSARVAALRVKPDRLAERIEEALTEPDPRRALRVMTELQLDTVLLAPSGPYVDRARTRSPRRRMSCAQAGLGTERARPCCFSRSRRRGKSPWRRLKERRTTPVREAREPVDGRIERLLLNR